MVTIILGVLQVVGWINQSMPWALWAFIAVLILFMFLLAARLEAVTAEAKTMVDAKAAETVKLEARAVEAEAKVGEAEARASEAEAKSTSLGELDRELADQLWKYASDRETLEVLSDLEPYQIPRRTVRQIDDLTRLPAIRTPHDDVLAEHLDALVVAASQWLSELTPLVSPEGDRYTTRLDHFVSEENYKRHIAKVETLCDTAADLHASLLGYQRYYASLSAAPSIAL